MFSDPEIVANTFNDFFASIEEKVRSTIPPSNNHFSNFNEYNTLSYKLRNDLSTTLYSPKQLESTFIEISRNGKRNIIVGCIYKHPGMPITHFTDFYLTPLLNKINAEQELLTQQLW